MSIVGLIWQPSPSIFFPISAKTPQSLVSLPCRCISSQALLSLDGVSGTLFFFHHYFNLLIVDSHDILPLSYVEIHASHVPQHVHAPKDTSMYQMHSHVHRNTQIDIAPSRTACKLMAPIHTITTQPYAQLQPHTRTYCVDTLTHPLSHWPHPHIAETLMLLQALTCPDTEHKLHARTRKIQQITN